MTNTKKKNKTYVLIPEKTLYHLHYLATMNGWDRKDIGRVIDSLVGEAMSKMGEQKTATSFAFAIARWRQRLDMTPAEFAEYIGTSTNTIYNYENGRSMPQLYTARMIAEKLGVSIDELLSGK